MKKGGFWFLPQSWQALDATQTTEDDENLWYIFLFETLKLVENKLQRLNIIALIGYLGLTLFVNGISSSRQKRQNRRSSTLPLLQNIGCLVIIYGLVSMTAWLTLSHVDETNWAKDIRSGKAYRPSSVENNYDKVPTNGTLPTTSDVLLAGSYASDILATYSKVLDVSHPGNRAWKELVQMYGVGYTDLSPSLQTHLCQSVIMQVQQERRFLKQNTIRDWIVVTNEDTLVEYCRREFSSFSDPLLGVLLRQLDSLRDETKFGRWRDMAIHKTTILKYLSLWEEVLLPSSSISKSRENDTTKTHFLTSCPRYSQTLRSTKHKTSIPRDPLPKSPVAEEPFSGAYLKIGDIVEALFDCEGEGKVYI